MITPSKNLDSYRGAYRTGRDGWAPFNESWFGKVSPVIKWTSFAGCGRIKRMSKMNPERITQIEQAIKEYFEGSLAGVVCAKFKIDNTSLVKQMRKRGLVPRTKAESAAIKFTSARAFQKTDGEWVKVCRECQQEKPLKGNYQPDKTMFDGFASICYDCRNVTRRPKERKRYAEDPEHRRKCREEAKKWYEENPGLANSRERKRRFNMTEEGFAQRLEEQNGGCAACGSKDTGAKRGSKNKNWHVDHDHSCCSGKKTCGKCVRGLLCQPCNLILGLAKDNPETLVKLSEYLRGYVPNPTP